MEANQASSGGNFFTNLINVFFSPRQTMENVDANPKWFLPLVVLLVLILFFTMLTINISMKEGMDKQRAKLEERGLSDEEIDNAMQMGQKIGKVIAPISAVIGGAIMTALIALIILFIGNIILGGTSTFKKVFTVYIYSSFIGMLGMFIKTPLILAKKTMDIHFSPASFMNPDSAPKFLYSFLRSVDVFQIWQFIVLTIGFAVIYKFSMKKSAWAMAVLFVIYALISAFFYSWQM